MYVAFMQKFDWMKEVTPQDAAEMEAAEWDLDDVKLGPVEERYMQPSLIVRDDLFEKALEEAYDVSNRVNAFNAGEDVRPLRL
jgi:predicted restriction endonuclease